MQLFKKYFGFFIIILLSFWAINPFFAQDFFPMHDNTQVARVFEMAKVLRAGVFPVRVVPDLGYGYGYPIFNFYAPLAYYIGAGFTFLGFDALVATKIMMALGVVLAGVFMYLLAREFFGEFGGITSGLFYIYAPYHAVDIFVRGDVAEFWAYAFIPLAFLGFYKKNVLVGAVGLAGLILSHNLTAMMTVPFLLIIILLDYLASPKDKKRSVIYRSSLALFFGLAISSFYWIPALAEMKQTNVLSQIGGGANFRVHFVCISQLWNSPWGFGGSAPGCVDGMSFKIGKFHILASAFAVIFAFCFKKIKSKEGKIVLLSFFGLLVSIFLMLEVSKPVWEAISLMAFFQYPWRFLILASFFSSLLAGSLVSLFKYLNIKPYLIALPLIFFVLFFNQKLFVPQTSLSVTSADYTSEDVLKWTASKISDEYLPINFKKPKNQNDIYKGQLKIKVQDTPIEKFSNIVAFVSLSAMIIGIILFKGKKYE
jgi:hypothetical protein